MDTIKLLLPLENIDQQDVLQYYIACEFLKNSTPNKLLQLAKQLDYELTYQHDLSSEQIDCLRYMFRDWGYQHIKDNISVEHTTKLFSIDGTSHAPGHFLAAIDFAKRNPKDNGLLMRFGLMLLTHAALSHDITTPKIQAIEQLLASTEHTPSQAYKNPNSFNKVILVALYNIAVGVYCIWSITKTYQISL